jgi:hypothetical protein
MGDMSEGNVAGRRRRRWLAPGIVCGLVLALAVGWLVSRYGRHTPEPTLVTAPEIDHLEFLGKSRDNDEQNEAVRRLFPAVPEVPAGAVPAGLTVVTHVKGKRAWVVVSTDGTNRTVLLFDLRWRRLGEIPLSFTAGFADVCWDPAFTRLAVLVRPVQVGSPPGNRACEIAVVEPPTLKPVARVPVELGEVAYFGWADGEPVVVDYDYTAQQNRIVRMSLPDRTISSKPIDYHAGTGRFDYGEACPGDEDLVALQPGFADWEPRAGIWFLSLTTGALVQATAESGDFYYHRLFGWDGDRSFIFGRLRRDGTRELYRAHIRP